MSSSPKRSRDKNSIAPFVGAQALIKKNPSGTLHLSTDKVPQHDDGENDTKNMRNAVYTAMKSAHCMREPLKRHTVRIECCQHGEKCDKAKMEYYPSNRGHDSQNSENDRSNVESSAQILPTSIRPRNLGKFELASPQTKPSDKETDADYSMITKMTSFTAKQRPLVENSDKVVDEKNAEKIEAAKKVDKVDNGVANQPKEQQQYETFDPAHYYVGTCTKKSAVKHLKEAYHFRFYHPKISRANANLEALEEKIPLHLIYRQTNDGEKITEVVIRTRSTNESMKEVSLDGEKWFSSLRDLLKHYSKNGLPNA